MGLLIEAAKFLGGLMKSHQNFAWKLKQMRVQGSYDHPFRGDITVIMVYLPVFILFIGSLLQSERILEAVRTSFVELDNIPEWYIDYALLPCIWTSIGLTAGKFVHGILKKGGK